MTDKEALLALLDRFGIGKCPYSTDNEIILREGVGNVGGYMEFYATFTFDDEGRFEHFGVWE